MARAWRIGAAALSWAAVAAACNAITNVGEYTYDGICRVDVDCNDDNPCTIDTCTARLCSHEATSSEPPRISGNCSTESCESGALVLTPDSTDSDDGDPCTDDYCNDPGGAAHVPKTSGDGCSVGALSGTCQAGGCRISCQNAQDCNVHRSCIDWDCLGGVCVFTEKEAGTPCGPDGGTCSAGGDCG